MRDEARVVTNALLSYGSRAVQLLVGLVMVPYLLGALGETRYGTIGIANSLMMGMIVIEFGLRPAASRQFTRFLFGGEIERANRLASTSMAVYASMGALLLVLTALAGGPFLDAMGLPAELRDQTWWVLLAVAGSVAVSFLRAPYEAALASQLRYDVMQYCEAGGAAFRAAFIVACFEALAPELIYWALASVVWSALSLAIHAWQAHRHCPALRVRSGLVARQGAGDLLQLGAWAGIMRAAQWLAESSGAIVIGALMGAASVAFYQPAIVLILALNPLSRAFLAQLTPVVTRAWAEGREHSVGRVLVRSTRYSLLLGGAASALVASTAHALVPVWLGPGFEATAWVLTAWAARSVLQAAAGGSFSVFLGTGRIAVAALINSSVALAGVLGSIWLVRETQLGVVGPAVAMLAAQVLRTIGWFEFASRFAAVPRGRYLREAFAGPGLALAALVAAALGTRYALDASPLVELFASVAAAGAAFAAPAWFAGLNAEDRAKALGYGRAGLRFARASLRPGRSGP